MGPIQTSLLRFGGLIESANIIGASEGDSGGEDGGDGDM